MAERANHPGIKDKDIVTEMRTSFLDYAMSIIVSRALPDVRDGLKPVHRRILYAMSELGVTPDKPYKKSARIVGEVIGKYHPHGDAAVYETMVGMAQDFTYRYMLVDGHGNFGSVDGDAAAAMRYTEARLSKIAMEMLRDIQKDTVDFRPNYSNEESEPEVLPSRFPNILVNGSYGIAVGMATAIPPHNLREVIEGLHYLIDHPDATSAELMKFVKGPDFPTAGLILGRKGIQQAYETGRGTITVRARTELEEAGGKYRIVVKELPYKVNKAKLIEKIAELVRDRQIDGIVDLRDESDRSGMRVVIELRRDANPNVVLNQLFKHTALQTTFGVIMLALVDGEPKVLSLRDVLVYYLRHQQTVIRRRTAHDLKKAEARAHILEGLRIALDHLDEVITLIRSSKTVEEARDGLMSRFGLTEEQARAILDMRLQRLTGLEREKIEEEYRELIRNIERYRAILADERLVLGIIRDELAEIADKYGDARRTEIVEAEDDILEEDLIQRDDVVVTITRTGYIKRLPLSAYRSQHRGGKGVIGIETKEEDFAEHLLVTETHRTLIFFTDRGKAYVLKAYEIPDLSRTARGTPIINLLQIEPGERVRAVIPVASFDEGRHLFFATRQGLVKKTPLAEFANIRRTGLIALSLRENDDLIDVRLTNGDSEIMLATKQGMSIRFSEAEVRAMGRTASGVKGIELSEDDEVIGMDVVRPDDDVLIVTSKGYGKRTPASEYRRQARGGKGIRTLNVTPKNGRVVALKMVREDDDLIILTASGTVIRTAVSEISSMGRNTQGVKLIQIREDDEVAAVASAGKNSVPTADDQT